MLEKQIAHKKKPVTTFSESVGMRELSEIGKLDRQAEHVSMKKQAQSIHEYPRHVVHVV